APAPPPEAAPPRPARPDADEPPGEKYRERRRPHLRNGPVHRRTDGRFGHGWRSAWPNRKPLAGNRKPAARNRKPLPAAAARGVSGGGPPPAARRRPGPRRR